MKPQYVQKINKVQYSFLVVNYRPQIGLELRIETEFYRQSFVLNQLQNQFVVLLNLPKPFCGLICGSEIEYPSSTFENAPPI